MVHEEVCAELPWEAEGEDPDGGEPHSGVIVEVAGGGEFVRPVVEAFDAGVSGDGVLVVGEFPLFFESGESGGVVVPDGGSHFQPAFPVGAPGNFLEKFFGGFCAVFFEDCAGGFLFCDEACADVGGE